MGSKGPLTHRLAVPPLPKVEGKESKSLPSPLGRGKGVKITALSAGERGDRKAVGERSLRGWRIDCLRCVRPPNPGNISVTASHPWPVLAS